MRLDWSDHAVTDLKAISEYIENGRGLNVANRVARDIYEAVQRLRVMPRLGRSGTVGPARELLISPTASHGYV